LTNETDGFYDFFCGCRLLKQEQNIFNIGAICPKHASEKSTAIFHTMVQSKIDNGVKPRSKNDFTRRTSRQN